MKKRRGKRRPYRLIAPVLLLTAVLLAVKLTLGAGGQGSAAGPGPIATDPTIPSDDPGYTVITMRSEDLSAGSLVLVNAGHPWTAFDSTELVSIYEKKTSSYFVRETDMLLQGEALTALNAMLDDFYTESGLHTINVVAGYRSYSYQEDLYNTSLAENGEEHTAQYIALPGCSEHHTGLAVDLGIYYSDSGLCDRFDGTGDYAWFGENAWQYGYVVRYDPEKSDITGIASEPWHLRYVGTPHAQLMAENGLCLEEYMEYLRGFPYEGEHLSVQADGESYEIYWCEGLSVHVPADAPYEVSGDNADGFVVTVTR